MNHQIQVIEKAAPAHPALISDINPQHLMELAIEKGSSLEFLERLLAISTQLMQEEAAKAFDAAMCEFQRNCPVITKSKIVKDKQGKERYRYAELGDIVSQVGGFIADAGFSYRIKTLQQEMRVLSIVEVSHQLGHREISQFEAPVDKDAYMSEPQKWSSAASYGKRIAFCNAFGILTGDGDDDANLSHPEHDEPRQQAQRTQATRSATTTDAKPEDKRKALEAIGRQSMAFPPGTLEPFLAGRKPADMTVPALRVLYKEMTTHLEGLPKAAAPAEDDRKTTAIKRLWATTHDLGLTEAEARYAFREFDLVARNAQGDADTLNKAADWFGTCDVNAIRMGLQAEQDADLSVDF